MLNIKPLNINNLINETTHVVNKMLSIEEDWFEEVTINSDEDIAKSYAKICQQHSVDNKWVLLVNPNEEGIEQLSHAEEIDVNKVLRVNANDINVSAKSLEKTLLKGNCAAVVVSNTRFTDSQLRRLEKSAQRGRTQFVVMNKSALH